MGTEDLAIVGIGASRVGRLRGLSALRLTLEAAKSALADAGLKAQAIDGVLTRNLDMDVTYMHSQFVAKHLGMAPRFTSDLNLGGATAVAMLEQAALLIAANVCRFVLCVYGENRRTSWAHRRHGQIRMGNEDFEECFGLTWGMGPHALAAQRHMHEFGTTSRPLGMIAVAQRQYALLHPNADFRQPLGLEEYEQAPLLIAPLRKYDLASVFDGGAAYIVAPLSWARDHIACPVRLSGVAQAHSREHLAYCAEMVTNTTTHHSCGRVPPAIHPSAYDNAGILRDLRFTLNGRRGADHQLCLRPRRPPPDQRTGDHDGHNIPFNIYS
jgi:acetyl-CoA acetyltransferase